MSQESTGLPAKTHKNVHLDFHSPAQHIVSLTQSVSFIHCFTTYSPEKEKTVSNESCPRQQSDTGCCHSLN